MMVGAQRSRLARQIIGQVQSLCGDSELISAEQRDWASATFSGARHMIELLVPVGAVARALAALPHHDFGLTGEIVADCSAATCGDATSAAGRVPLRVELLTVVAD